MKRTACLSLVICILISLFPFAVSAGNGYSVIPFGMEISFPDGLDVFTPDSVTDGSAFSGYTFGKSDLDSLFSGSSAYLAAVNSGLTCEIFVYGKPSGLKDFSEMEKSKLTDMSGIVSGEFPAKFGISRSGAAMFVNNSTRYEYDKTVSAGDAVFLAYDCKIQDSDMMRRVYITSKNGNCVIVDIILSESCFKSEFDGKKANLDSIAANISFNGVEPSGNAGGNNTLLLIVAVIALAAIIILAVLIKKEKDKAAALSARGTKSAAEFFAEEEAASQETAAVENEAAETKPGKADDAKPAEEEAGEAPAEEEAADEPSEETEETGEVQAEAAEAPAEEEAEEPVAEEAADEPSEETEETGEAQAEAAEASAEETAETPEDTEAGKEDEARPEKEKDLTEEPASETSAGEKPVQAGRVRVRVVKRPAGETLPRLSGAEPESNVCFNCGNKLGKDEFFCKKCGTKVVRID